jgi:hypothetical protein
MLALSIRQPWAELIIRGVKTVEYRSRPTRVLGRRFWIYAAKGRGQRANGSDRRLTTADLRPLTSDNLAAEQPPAWMIELAEQVRMIEPGTVLPTGVIVGTAVIDRVEPAGEFFGWHLADVKPVTQHRKPSRQPQPVWFVPF